MRLAPIILAIPIALSFKYQYDSNQKYEQDIENQAKAMVELYKEQHKETVSIKNDLKVTQQYNKKLKKHIKQLENDQTRLEKKLQATTRKHDTYF